MLFTQRFSPTFVVVAAVLGGCSADIVPATLHKVPASIAEKHGAACLDGTPPAYYLAPANSTSMASTWVLYFKGGGWAYDWDSSVSRAKGELGTSNLSATTFSYAEGPFSGDPALNPALAGANRVLLWYCDGCSFSGSVTGPVTRGNDTLYFRGRHNLDAILEDLMTSHGLNTATDVLLSGGSAGGLSSFLHADYVQSQLPASVQRYKVAPGSGYFMPAVDATGDPYYIDNMRTVFELQNASLGMNPRCLAAHDSTDAWKCIFAPSTYPYIEAPIFPLQSGLDSWQMGNVYPRTKSKCTSNHFAACNSTEIDGLNNFAATMLTDANTTRTWLKDGNGGFWHSCLMHVGEQGNGWQQYQINGVSMADAFLAWWNDSNEAPAARHTHFQTTFLQQGTPHQTNPSCL